MHGRAGSTTGGAPAWLSEQVLEWLHEVVTEPVLMARPEQSTMAEQRGRTVVHVVDGAQRDLYLKVEPRRQAWRAEVRAYRRWLPSLGDLAPTLHAADRSLRTVVTTAVPGASPDVTQEDHQQQAGAWLRRLHDARPPRPAQDKEWAVKRAERLPELYPGLFGPRVLAFVREQARVIEDEHDAAEVPSHGDFRQHNWLVDEHGVLRVIDFGAARWAPPTVDLSGLAFGHWWDSPQMKQAFLEGYGRALTEREERAIVARTCLRAVRTVVLGHEHRVKPKVDKGRRRLARLMRAADAGRTGET